MDAGELRRDLYIDGSLEYYQARMARHGLVVAMLPSLPESMGVAGKGRGIFSGSGGVLGCGYGDGESDGEGYGEGYGEGNGSGNGSGSGSGHGRGVGWGRVRGSGFGRGHGHGNGDAWGEGL